MSRSDTPAVAWLDALGSAAAQLPAEVGPRPHWSQRTTGHAPAPDHDHAVIVRRVRALIAEFDTDHFFAEVLGYDCVDSTGDTDSTPEDELSRRVGKPDLWTRNADEWSEADLCDFIEVFHDLAARPTRSYVHSYMGCGRHPTEFSRRSGQRLYRWRMNRLLATTTLDVRVAEDGEDVGRMVRQAPGDLNRLVTETLDLDTGSKDEIAHAVALFRSRSGTVEEKRSAIVALAGVLESRRPMLEVRLTSKDEGALFMVANKFHLRHRDASQMKDYPDEYLDWIFYWYLATVRLAEQLLAKGSAEG